VIDMAVRQSGCVLVVDDEEDIRETLREVVEMGGCEAMVAANGADALQMLSQRRPCLVILDLLMPVMNGEEMLAAMRKQPELAGLPVVISTSAPERAPAGVPVLRKPLNLQALWDLMRLRCACGATTR
jgi:two-component system, chemotaxis family, chemotaxis protein CheY